MSDWHPVASEPRVPRSGFYRLGVADGTGAIIPIMLEYYLGSGYPIKIFPFLAYVTHWRRID
jgi:hypothetical protein